jgi:uncharacterized protein (DUF4415 family)
MAWTIPDNRFRLRSSRLQFRLDADGIHFFRQTGRRYQSRINAALLEYVDAQKQTNRKTP